MINNARLLIYCLYLLIALTIIIILQSQSEDEPKVEESRNDDDPLTNVRKLETLADSKFIEPPDSVFFPEISRLDNQDVGQSYTDSENYITSLHLKDYLDSPSKMSDFNFNNCRMYNCFDFDRCKNSRPIKVHIVGFDDQQRSQPKENATLGESNIIHDEIINIIRQSHHFEPDPSKACLFVLNDDTLDRDPLSTSFRQNLFNLIGPENNFGMNYLIFNLYSGTWPNYKEDDFAGLQFNAAILAKASNSIAHHRPNFDISLPLFSYQHPYNDSTKQSEELELSLKDENKNYFLTFKGKRYLIGSGSQTRNNLYHLNNQRDVFLLTTCRHGKKWREASDSRCLEEEEQYDQYDFNNLMKDSTFCLVPRGRRLGSFRFLEALSFGCIPVVMSDGWVLPFDEIINWSNVSIQYDESIILHVPDMLRDVDKRTIEKMRNNCGKLYNMYFSTVEKIIKTTLAIIEKRIQNHVNSA